MDLPEKAGISMILRLDEMAGSGDELLGQFQNLGQSFKIWAGSWQPASESSGLRRCVPHLDLTVAASHLRCRGGQGRARTADTGLFRAVLYQLSYLTEWEIAAIVSSVSRS